MDDVIDEFYDGPHATPPESLHGPIYLGIKNISDDGHLDFSHTRRISEADYVTWTRRIEPRPGDLVFTYEATLHRYAVLPPGFRGALGRRIALIRPRTDRVETKFLYYVFLSPQWRKTIEQRVNIGSTVDRIPLTEFRNYPVSLPPLDYQHKVSRVLGSIDDLIANNERRIEILEDLARLLYREWFVHFRFPGHEAVDLTDSDLGRIPVGWSTGVFSDLVSEITSTIPPDEINVGTPVVRLEHLPRRSTTLREWESASHVGSRRKVFVEGDILFGKIRPYFHKVVDAPVSGCSSTDAIVLRPARDLLRSRALAVASSDEFVGIATATSNGTRMPRANTAVLLAYGIPHPTREIEQVFRETVGPMDSLRKVLAAQNRKLRAARDLLLPRLISGELDAFDLNLDFSAASA